MAKKKKFGASLKQQVNLLPVVKEKAPRTISTNVSTGGMRSAVSSTTQSVAKSARQKAEEDRSARMRQGLSKTFSSVVRSSFNQKMSQPTRVKKGMFQNLGNALQPVKKNASTTANTRSTGAPLGKIQSSILAPVKQDINDNYYDAVRKVGMKGSRNERKVYVPMWQRDENGQISSNQRRLENAARGGNRKAQVEAVLGRTKAQTRSGHTYDQYINAELNKKGLLGQDYILRSKDPSKEAMDYRQRYGFDKEALDRVLAIANNTPASGDYVERFNGQDDGSVLDRLKFGFDESYRARNIEDTLRRQYGVELSDEDQAKLDAVRDSGGYMVGNMLGQASQFALTAPLSGAVEGKLLSKVGLEGGKAAIKTTGDALKYAGARIGADQIVSAPVNILDALKADNGEEFVKRLGLNTTMDVFFGGLTELPGLRKNIHFVRGLEMNNAANATSDASQKLVAKVGAQRELRQAVEEAGDAARLEAIQNAGYHAGDLGKAENYFQQASGYRHTGHYGTGTYFGGKEDMFSNSSGYGDRPEWKFDFDGYNLYKPKNYEQGIRVHDGLATIDRRSANGLLNDLQLSKDADAIRRVLDDYEYSNPKERLDELKDIAEKYLSKNDIDRIENDALSAYNYESARINDENYLENRKNEAKSLYEMLFPEDEIDDAAVLDLIASEEPQTLPTLDEFRLNYYSDELRKQLDGDVPFGRTSLAEHIENAQNTVKQLAQDLGKTEDEVLNAIEKAARKVEKEYPNVSQSSGMKDLDSEATLVMKNLGYDGVDVRGIDGLDNTEYGSVIYDLKPESRRQQIREGVPRGQKPKTETPRSETVAKQPAETPNRIPDEWNGIPNVAKSDEAPQDLMRANPHRKENTIPKASDQKTRKEVLFRGETADRNGVKETAEQVAETPKKRNQVKGILNGEEQAEKTAVEKQADWDEFDVKEAERKGRETVKREKKASEKYGDYPGGMPKRSAEGEELSKGADTLLSRDDSIVHEDVQLRGMEGVTNEGAGRKTTQKFNASLESAHERYKSDPRAFKERLKNARESVRNGKFPEGYDNPQDFISDEAELQKQFTRRLNAMEEGSDEYWDLVDEAWEYAQDAIAGGSQAGGYLRQYQAFIDAHPGVKAASIDKTLKRLYRQNEKRLKKIGIDEDTFIKNALPKEMRTAILTAETKEEASKAWAKASIHVWNQIPASIKEKVDFLRINAMLLNPKTHIRNIFGNALFVPMRELKNLTGTGLEYIAQKAGVLDKAARTKAVIPDKAAMKIAKDVRKNNPAIRGASRLLENLANGRPLESGMTFMAGRQNANAVINGVRKFLDKTGNANAWLLEHEDFLFFNGAFDRQFGRITKARGLTADDLLNNPKLLDDVTEAATEEALRATYRDESAAARIISKWKNPPKNASATRKAAGLALDAILPFTKTPINILRRAIDYSPAGAGKGIYHLARGIHDGNQKMIVRGLDQLSSAIPGTGLAMLGWFMSENDGVTAKLGSDKDDQFMKDLGKQNFSIVFNAGTDKEWSYTLDWAAPGCIPFFTGVAFKEMSDEGVDFWEAADAFEQMLEPMTEMSVMQGIKNTLETFQRESGGGVMQGLTSVGINTGLSYVGQFKPTLVSQAARTIDPVRRDTTSTAESASKRQIERWWNKQKAGIPGLSKTLNPYQNVWGETENNTYNDDLPMRIVENFFSPGYAKKYKADSVDKEIIKLYQQDPSADGVIPTKFSKYEIGFDGGTVRFSTDDRSNFIKVQGKVSKQDLHKLFDSQEYKNASLTDKQKMIANVYSDAKGQAKRDTLLKMGKDEWKVYTDDFDTGSRKKDYSDAKAAGIKADQYYELMTNKDWDLDENGSPMKSELALYLNADDNLTDEQRSVIFSKLASGNTKNPYEDGTAHTTDWQAEYNAKKNKDKNSGGSSKGKSKSKKGRSGRRSGGGGSSKTKARAKTASEKRFAALQKMKAPTTGKGIEALSQGAKGLTKAQKKALLKLMQKKLEV